MKSDNSVDEMLETFNRINNCRTCAVYDLANRRNNASVVLHGFVGAIKESTSRDGSSFLTAEFTDLSGSANLQFTSEFYSINKDLFEVSLPALIKGRIISDDHQERIVFVENVQRIV